MCYFADKVILYSISKSTNFKSDINSSYSILFTPRVEGGGEQNLWEECGHNDFSSRRRWWEQMAWMGSLVS
jgi:hypothetical protein